MTGPDKGKEAGQEKGGVAAAFFRILSKMR